MDIIANRATYASSTPWFNTTDDFQTPQDIRNEASQWNTAIGNGGLTRQGIKDNVFHNAHNQNVYLESIEQRLEAMENQPDEQQPSNRLNYIDLQNEIADVKASAGDDLSAVFNDKLTLLSERAGKKIVTDDPEPGPNH